MAINPGLVLAPVSQAVGNLQISSLPVALPTLPLSQRFGILNGLPQNPQFPLISAGGGLAAAGIPPVSSLAPGALSLAGIMASLPQATAAQRAPLVVTPVVVDDDEELEVIDEDDDEGDDDDNEGRFNLFTPLTNLVQGGANLLGIGDDDDRNDDNRGPGIIGAGNIGDNGRGGIGGFGNPFSGLGGGSRRGGGSGPGGGGFGRR